jgi:hypothetical protein
MPADFPGRATVVSQSKFYTGLFLITACRLMLNNTDGPSAILWIGAMATAGLSLLDNAEEQHL